MSNAVIQTVPVDFQWPTIDPFLFCVHHNDAYPAGNGRFGPDVPSFEGRDMGQDFAGIDGWRMYHGTTVPGFPAHPHRGFETITVVRKGLIDHSDSLGAAARFGSGDVQWVTAGSGIVHSEMFPLLDTDHPNPCEFFQIWFNLPGDNKMVDPHFTMLWDDEIPRRTFTDQAGRTTDVTVVAGTLDGAEPPPPPPNSWAARADADVAIWLLRLDANAEWTLPPAASAGAIRTVYVFEGDGMRIDGTDVANETATVLHTDQPVGIEALEAPVECLVLQGRAIDEPVAQYGPFVMNTRAEIEQAIADYRRTEFGGWPWSDDGPVHGDDPVRFARHDGHTEHGASATTAAPTSA